MGYSGLTSILVLLLITFNEYVHAKQRVCVVGAGMAGLAAIKLLRDHPQDFEPIAFEKNSDVGGLWIYTDSTNVDEHGLPVHSSVYKNLRINVPKEMMAYQDYLEFKGRENRSFVTHESVYEYLRNYTEHFNLRPNIKVDTLVEKVTPILVSEDWRSTKWIVKLRNLNSNTNDETICDAVMVCNGAFVKSNIPKIPGMESFPGRVLHSHTYRHPEEFKDQTVVLLGVSASGQDIAEDLSPYAKTIYLSHRHRKLPKKFPDNVVQVRGVITANGSELTLQDGSKITADSFIFCTGYLRDFPFLDESSGIFVEKKSHVRPLYKFIVNVEHPSMAFIGMPHFAIKGIYFYSQVKFFLNLLRGKVTLPSHEVMIEDSKTPPPETQINDGDEFYDPQWDYNIDLAKEGKFETAVLPFYKKAAKLLYDMAINVEDLKDYDLKILDNGNPTFVHRKMV